MNDMKEQVLFVYADNEIREEEILETIELMEACDMEMLQMFTQRLASVTFATYIGKGKVMEILTYLQEHPCTCVVFQQELTPLQLANLEATWDCSVITRSDLIVEIFARRANSQEAKLQVESARLKKLLPRLIGRHTSLGRQGGGKNKGVGEKQLEIDRRRVKSTIQELDKQLKQLQHHREVQRRQRGRSDLKQVALVGYTNSGKSTLLNTMLMQSKKTSGSIVLEKDMVFATLDTSVRKVNNQGKDNFLLFDTVGFISNLPHQLVKAFHSTLEEVCYADLLIQVIDASSSRKNEHCEVTMNTLHTIHADHIPMIKVFNKCDASSFDYPKVTAEGIYISAKEQVGMDFLHQAIQKELYGEQFSVSFAIPYDKSPIISDILRDCRLIQQENRQNECILEVTTSKMTLTKYGNYVKFAKK